MTPLRPIIRPHAEKATAQGRAGSTAVAEP